MWPWRLAGGPVVVGDSTTSPYDSSDRQSAGRSLGSTPQIDSPVGKLYERWDYKSDMRLGLAVQGVCFPLNISLTFLIAHTFIRLVKSR